MRTLKLFALAITAFLVVAGSATAQQRTPFGVTIMTAAQESGKTCKDFVLADDGTFHCEDPTEDAAQTKTVKHRTEPADIQTATLLREIYELSAGDESARRDAVVAVYDEFGNDTTKIKAHIAKIKAGKASPTTTGEPIASENLVGHENEYHNPPCGNDAPFNEVTKDGKIIPRCFKPASTSVNVVGKAPEEPNPTKVHVPDPPKTEDPEKVHVQDSTAELDYKKLVEEEMRGLIDESKSPAAVSDRNNAMRQAAHKEALERYLDENCGSGILHRAKNTFECGRKRAELSSIANTNELASYNRKGNMTACVGTPAQIVNGHVVEKLHVEGASMGLLVVNDSDLVWKIDSPSRIHTNGPAGPIAVDLCPHSSFTPNFVLTALFGPGSGYTSSRRSSNEKRQEILLVATSEPLPDGTVLHDEFRFTLDTNGYVTSDSDSWYIGRRVQPSVQFRPTQKSSGTTGSGRRSVGGLFGGGSGTSTEENETTDEEKPVEQAKPRPSVGGLLGGRR